MTTYNDYRLRAPSAETLDALLVQAGILQLDEEGSLYPTEGITFVRLGILSHGGEWDEEGNEVVAPTVREGYHADMRVTGELTEAQLGIMDGIVIEEPGTPVHRFG